MSIMNASTLLPAALFLLVAAPSAPLAAQDYYTDVRPVLVQRCMSCHTSGGAGWAMDDPAETLATGRRIVDMVLRRAMPPWLAERGHQEYVGDASLDPAVIEIFDQWRDRGFPMGEPRPDPARAGHHAFRPDVAIPVLPDGPYLPNQERPDDYRCFVADWPEEEPGYVTGFRASPGNRLVAHHVVVHAVSPEMAERFRELDAEEEGAGYQCFGGAVPDRLDESSEREAYEARYPDGVTELARGSFWLAHWAPGMDGHEFPDGTGIRMEPGSALVVQMHYYGAQAPGERDADTMVEFKVAPEVERPAFHLPQTHNPWLAGERNGSMVIEPGETATYQVTDDLEDLLPYIAHVTGVDEARVRAVEIHSVNLHMHAFGHSGEVSLVDGNGRRETLLSIPRWDLRWQRDFVFTRPKHFARSELDGTTLTVRCTFRNDREETVYGGYGSFDEMCFNFSYVAVEPGKAPIGSGPGR
jgi:hypothetical protein